MSKMGSHEPFGHLQHKLWQKKSRESNWQFDSRLLKVKNRPDPGVCRWSAIHCWKVLIESYKFVLNLIPIGGLNKDYDTAKWRESKPKQFRDYSLGISKQKAIWMWPLWRAAEYNIWGKVVASPESKLWWVLWIQSPPWLVLAPRVLQLVGWLNADSNE
jgi:hypothetical protein